MTKFKIDYNEKHDVFEICTEFKGKWYAIQGEPYTRDEFSLEDVLADATKAGYEFCGCTCRAFAEIYG